MLLEQHLVQVLALLEDLVVEQEVEVRVEQLEQEIHPQLLLLKVILEVQL